jgi:tripartite-type tricarboxylate transporter receptor subunit TctC
VPVGQFAELPFVLAVTATLPANNVKDLVDHGQGAARQADVRQFGQRRLAAPVGETFKIATGTQILHMPYKGGGAAMTDLMAGNVDMIFASVLETSGFIKAASSRPWPSPARRGLPRCPMCPRCGKPE